MSAISLKSITGITSITTPAGVDNQLTLHNNNTTEAVKLDVAGNLHFHNHLNITGVSTASNFKTGTSNLHNTGLNVQDLDVDGHTNLDNVSIAGVTTTTDHIYIDADNKKLNIGDGSDLQLYHTGSRSEIINNTGDLIIQPGASSNLFLRSQTGAAHFKGAHAAQVELYWNGNKKFETSNTGAVVTGILTATSFSGDGSNLTGITQTTINNNADNRVITGSGTANTLEGESLLTFDGNVLLVASNSYNILEMRADENNDGGNDDNILKFTHDGTFRAEMRYDQSSSTLELSTSDNRGDIVIGSDGKVGINESSPTRALSINGDMNLASGSKIESYSSGGNLQIQGGSTYPGGHIKMYGGSGDDMITFNTSGAGVSSLERLRISSAGKVLIGDGSSITPSRNLDVRGTGHQQILIGSTNNAGASLMVDGSGGGDGSGGDYCTFEAASDGHLKIRNYDADKNIIFGVGSNTGAEDTLVLTSDGNLGLSNTGTNNPNNYSGWNTLTLNGTSGAELDFEKAGTLHGDIYANATRFAMTTRDSSTDIFFATKNNAGSTADRLKITSEGNIQHVNGSGVSYFNGASEYVFGSTGSSPASGGAEANVQIHAHKTRAQFSINAYMNNAGGPYMQLVSSRSGTVGTLGSATANNDSLGAIRFSADDGNGGIVYGAQITGRAKSAATTNGIAGRIEFDTAKDSSSTTRQIFSMNEGGAFTAESEAPALYGYYTSVNNQNHHVDFSQWTRDSFICLEIFGNVNPNSAGSGAYTDPVHMYVYRGIGWTGSRLGYYIYSVSVAPPARHAFPSGTGYSGNAQISAVWTDGSSNLGNETATSTNYLRLLVPNGNNTYNFQKQFRIFRRR